MDMYVYNKALDLIGVTDQVTSLMWTKRYPLGDTFTAVFPANENNLKLIRPQMIIEIPGRYSGIITHRSMSGTKGVINVSGCSFDGMLNSRAIADGSYTDSLLTIIDKNLGEAVKNTKRRFECTYVDKTVDCAKLDRETITYMNLGDYASKICNENGLLLRSEIEHGDRNKIRIYARKSADRSIHQDANAPVVFSELYDNVSSMDTIYSEEGSINSAFIYSEAESDTVAAWQGEFGDGEGYSRREGVYQIDPVIVYDYKLNKDGDTIWYPVLDRVRTAQRASDFFKNNCSEFTDCIDATVKLDADYAKRFDVGDIVTVYSSRFGISQDARITEISESFTTSGLSINVTFGEPMKCLKQMIGGR